MKIKIIRTSVLALFLSGISCLPVLSVDVLAPTDSGSLISSMDSAPNDISSFTKLRNVEAGQVYENRVRNYEQKPEVFRNENVDLENENVGLPEAPKQAEAVSDDIMLYLEHVQFEGNTAIKTSELEKLARDYIIGRDVTLAYVGQFAEKITKTYQDKGYITSFAFLPPQTIKDKTIKIKIFEGKIGDIAISGNKFSSTNFIKYQLLQPYFVEKGKVLNVNDVRQALIELNEKGFISGTIVLKKGKEKGTTDLNLGVKDKQPFTLSVGFDNAGRDLIGKERLSVFVADNNLTGHGDVLSGAVSFGSRSFSVGPQYSLPVGNRGDKVYASYGFSKIKPGGQFAALGYEGKAHIITLGITNPVYKSHNVTVDWNTSFSFKEGQFNIAPSSNYSVRTLSTGVQVVQKDKYGRTYFNAGTNIGIPLFGGGKDCHFMDLTGGVVRQFWLPGKGIAMLRFNGQVSPDSNIPAIEQFQVGGFQTVRGYDEAILLGKTGFTAGAQVNFPIPFLPKSVPIWKKGDNVYRLPVRDRIQLVGFYDCGYSSDDYTNQNFIQSIGTGLRVYLTKYLTASVDFGFPIGARPYNANRFRTHFFLSSNIL